MQYRYIVTPAGANRYMYTIASNGPDRIANTRDDLSVQFMQEAGIELLELTGDKKKES